MGDAPEDRDALNRKEPPAGEQPPATLGSAHGEDIRAMLPHELPILPVRNLVVFPGTVVPLSIGREKSRLLTDAVLAGDKLLALFTQRREDTEDPGLDDLYRIGTAAQVLKVLKLPDGSNSLLVHGLVRVGIETLVTTEPYWRAVVNPYIDQVTPSLELDALVHNARQVAREVIELSPNVPDEARLVLDNIDRPDALSDFLAANLSLGVVQKQELLETFDVVERLKKVTAILNNQLEVLRLSQKIQESVRKEIDKSQRDFYLHEQLKAIQKELGESEGVAGQIEEFRKRIDASGMPDPVRKEAERELDRLERVPQASPESGVIRDYLTWLCELPWNKETPDNLDLDRAEKILNDDHYGLTNVKRRIIEYLAVRKLNPASKGPILCFVGPPGVGKTSLGQSIARALGRTFIRIALGGVRDEADIRGHRRTYIGAIPGRIVQEIRKAATRNPVLMLDELDKVGADFRGDPASALLEVLDPAQNHSFTDHYLSVPFDLSKVLFIGTANYIDPVAPALRDRMEIIDLPGYTSFEKFEIAKRYLVPRQLAENGLTDHKVTFSDDAIRMIIERYTREAGVRNLERSIGTVCRGLAAKVARNKLTDVTVDPEDLEEYLGPPRFERELALERGLAGVVTGLAYTPVGGEIIFVEATAMEGRGNFALTGQIGDVMRESGQAALSFIRSRAKQWGLKLPDLGKTDIHIHVPAGGVPKDGPSAGVAMVSALASLFSGQIADPSVGMTGEITLRGQVLPIGGVKEKVLAAHRAGLKKVVLPARNEPDLQEVPSEVRNELQFAFCRTIEDVLTQVLPGQRWPAAPVAGETRTPNRRVTAVEEVPAAKSAQRGPAKNSTVRGRSQKARQNAGRRRPNSQAAASDNQ
jgi:ATP-dependent Lon protease